MFIHNFNAAALRNIYSWSTICHKYNLYKVRNRNIRNLLKATLKLVNVIHVNK